MRRLGMGLLLMVAACANAVPAAREPTVKPSTTHADQTSPSVHSMQLLTSHVGWALTDRALVITVDGGDHWQDITPSGVDANELAGVWFLDPDRGWVAQPSPDPRTNEPGRLHIFRTVDGGRHWIAGALEVPPAVYGAYGAAYFFFLDPMHGWLSFDLGNNTTGTRASLFFTSDGGATWSERTTPLNAPVRFSTLQDGWTAGGPTGDRLYVTRDGARTWHAQALDDPGSCASGQTRMDVPTFWTAADGVLPIGVSKDGGQAAVFYVTHDTGRTWKPTPPVCADPSDGNFAATDVVGSRVWMVAFANGSGLYSTKDAGGHWSFVTPKTNDVLQIDYVRERFGWWRTDGGGCRGFKTDCYYSRQLMRDTGDSVDLLDPQPEVEHPTCDPRQISYDSGLDGASGGTVVNVGVQHSGGPCRLRLSATLTIQDSSGRALDIEGNPSTQTIERDLPEEGGPTWLWQNWCTDDIPIRYVFDVSGRRLMLDSRAAPRCDVASGPSTLAPINA